ncbi:hypothetical protein [Aureispira anguillae]|uniref:Uncharacterized protein n=1 Tax=Aureispira anguillae TaxID=2864201 RepID=A0A915YDW9_9BACT|nr:hypothetical protein [Aureispira anguillae]BDS11327.1 hypothetical protein AsAng_0020390 [Aureispira anguillae]
MKNKTIYFGSAIVLAIFFFTIIYSNRPSNAEATEHLVEENNKAFKEVKKAIPFPSNTPDIIPITSVESIINLGLLGHYWNHNFVRLNTPNSGDESLSLSINPENENSLALEFTVYTVHKDRTVENLSSCHTIPLNIINNTLFIDTTEYTCFQQFNRMCFLKIGNQIGLSFNGKHIAFYSQPTIFPNVYSPTLLKGLYPHPYYTILGDSIADGGVDSKVSIRSVETLALNNEQYSLAFLIDQFYVEYDPRQGGDLARALSIALFKKTEQGHQLLYFDDRPDYSHFSHKTGGHKISDLPKNFRIQQIGKNYFFFKEVVDELNDKLVKTVYCYDLFERKEVFSHKLEQYTVGVNGKKNYSYRKQITFAEKTSDCAIIINAWNLEENVIKPLGLTVYVYDEDSNEFVNPNNLIN